MIDRIKVDNKDNNEDKTKSLLIFFTLTKLIKADYLFFNIKKTFTFF